MFTFGSDIPRERPPWARFSRLRRAWRAVWAGPAGLACLSCGDLVLALGSPAVSGRGACGGQVGEGLAVSAAGPGRQAGRGAAGVVVLAGVPGDQDALGAGDEQAGEPEGERGQAHEAAPAAGGGVGGRGLWGGGGPFGARGPGGGPPGLPCRGGGCLGGP